jgi:hypothetical protein
MYTERYQDGQKGSLGWLALQGDPGAVQVCDNLVLTQLSQIAISGISRQGGCDDEVV